jgi:hypothetical protein
MTAAGEDYESAVADVDNERLLVPDLVDNPFAVVDLVKARCVRRQFGGWPLEVRGARDLARGDDPWTDVERLASQYDGSSGRLEGALSQ